MSITVQELKQIADNARYLYKGGHLSKQDTLEQVQPYLDIFNEKQAQLCIKYNQKYKPLTFSGYCGSIKTR